MSAGLAVQVRAALHRAADPARAPAMQAYMKSAMPYLGVGVPDVRRLTRAIAARSAPGNAAQLTSLVRTLWDEAGFREERYAAIALLDTTSGRALRGPEHLVLVRDLIVDGAWWDYVDELSHRVGDLLAGWPAQIGAEVTGWAAGPDLWLRRASIICQLGHRTGTDLALLTHAIEANTEHRDFFVRKAIGWALRDYARTDADWVTAFVDQHELSPLSRREALKHIRA